MRAGTGERRSLGVAERVGVLERDFAKANEINGFANISRNRNDLVSANSRRRLVRLLAFADFPGAMELEMALRMEASVRHILMHLFP